MIVKIGSIFLNDTKADGSQYINKNGEPFHMANLKSDQGNKASMYLGPNDSEYLRIIQGWRAGDEVEVIIEESERGPNFKPVTGTSKPQADQPAKSVAEIPANNIEDSIKLLHSRVNYLIGLVEAVHTANASQEPQNEPVSTPTAQVDPVADQKEKEAQELNLGEMKKPGDEGYIDVSELNF